MQCPRRRRRRRYRRHRAATTVRRPPTDGNEPLDGKQLRTIRVYRMEIITRVRPTYII